MINVNDLYLDSLDIISKEENGAFPVSVYNRYSWVAQLKMLDYLSGDLENEQPPIPYLSQKNKDWLSPFITRKDDNVTNGYILKPSNYYGYENLYRIGGKVTDTDCDDTDEENTNDCNTVIELLDGAKFTQRCNSYIEGLKPSLNKPIAKLVGNRFEFAPKDLGSVSLEYIRYPRKAVLKTKINTEYNDEEYDPLTSVDFEWDEYARPMLTWFIIDSFSNRVREQTLKQFNTASKP